jgi:serine/threonine-protein kinase
MSVGSSETTPAQGVAGKYRLLAELGTGGMGKVYLATLVGPSGFKKLIVLKMLRESIRDDPELCALFLEEARLAARLNHPNIVQTYEVVDDASQHMIVMEYLEGQSLGQIVDRCGARFPRALHLRILCEALSGLHSAHELADFDGTPLGIVHRDVSPHNILVTFDGQVKVVDFGIAKATNSTFQTETGVIKGKVRHMAPEQFSRGQVDRRADVFSVGTLLWELAAGEKLWRGLNDAEVMHEVINGKVVSPRTINPVTPESLERVCMKALSPKREDRYADCMELQAALEGIIRELGEGATQKDLARLMVTEFKDVREERRRIIEELSNLEKLERPLLLTEGAARSPSSGTRRAAGHEGESAPTAEPKSSGAPHPQARQSMRAVWLVMTVLLTGAFAFAVWKGGALARNAASSSIAQPPPPPLPIPASAAGMLTAAPSGTTGPVPSAQTAADTSSASPAPDVSVTISVTPPAAQIFLDGQRTRGNPFSARITARDAAHQVRAELTGYMPAFASVSGDRDTDLRLVLVPVAAPGQPLAPKEHAADATRKQPREPESTARPLDTDNPYGTPKP